MTDGQSEYRGQVRCGWCQATIREGVEPTLPVSHGICPACLARLKGEMSGEEVTTFLDELPVPVLTVDDSGRIRSANVAAERMLGKPRVELESLLGGEVMQCAFAALPGGCGQTEHCVACIVRRTVMATHETREPQDHVPAFLMHPDGQGGTVRRNYVVSTWYVDGRVLLRLDAAGDGS